MVLFKFFKSLFNRGGKKNKNKKRSGKLSGKIAKKPRKKLKHRTVKKIKSKINKKHPKKAKKKSKKTKKPLKKKNSTVRAKAKSPGEKEIGVITHYFDKISVGIIKLKHPLAVSECIRIKGKNTNFTQVVGSMQYNHNDIALAKPGLEIGIKVSQPVCEKDLVYKIML